MLVNHGNARLYNFTLTLAQLTFFFFSVEKMSKKGEREEKSKAAVTLTVPAAGDPVVDAGLQAFLNSSAVASPPRPTQANDHFLFPSPLPKLPWEMDLDERRRASKDPRIMKQVREEDQWLDTSCSGLWKLLRAHARPIADWKLNYELLCAFFSSLDVRGATFPAKVMQVFDPNGTGTVNALIICKSFLMMLDPSHELCEALVRHCFDRFDRPATQDAINKKDILKANLRPPPDPAVAAKAGGGGKKKKADSDPRPLTMVSGATYLNVEGLKKLLVDFQTKDEFLIEYLEFRKLFLNRQNGEWVGSFAVALFEVAAKYCTAPEGRLPTIPLRWLNTIEPVPFSDVMHDADIVLLKEIEITGVDPRANKDKKKKRSSSAKKQKQK